MNMVLQKCWTIKGEVQGPHYITVSYLMSCCRFSGLHWIFLHSKKNHLQDFHWADYLRWIWFGTIPGNSPGPVSSAVRCGGGIKIKTILISTKEPIASCTARSAKEAIFPG